MRLFVAVLPPEPARAHLARTLAAARRSCPQLSWVPTEAMHLTLAFLGEVPTGRADAVARAVAETSAGTRRGSLLHLAGGGSFGGSVVWAGVGGDVARLFDAAGSVRRALEAVGTTPEVRPFVGHVTVARRRGRARPADGSLGVVAAALETYVGPEWLMDRLHLVRSSPVADGGSRYTDLGSWPTAVE